MSEILYLVCRLTIDGVPTQKVVLNKTPDRKDGMKYAKRISKLTYGNQQWKFAGFLVTENATLDKITECHGAYDEAIFKRTGIDLRNFAIV